MSQESLVSQTPSSRFPNTIATWFPAGPPRGYAPLPYEEPEDYDDEELRTFKPASRSDIEAARPITRERLLSSSSPPQVRAVDIEHPPPDLARLHPKLKVPRIPIPSLGALKTSAAVLVSAALAALFFSAWAWFAGGYLLYTTFALAPYTAVAPGDSFRAAMAGAPVVALLVVGALVVLDAVCGVAALGGNRSEAAFVAGAASAVCGAVFAMPVGFAMMPSLMVGGFGLRHALAMGATGFGVAIVAFFLEALRSVGSRR